MQERHMAEYNTAYTNDDVGNFVRALKKAWQAHPNVRQRPDQLITCNAHFPPPLCCCNVSESTVPNGCALKLGEKTNLITYSIWNEE